MAYVIPCEDCDGTLFELHRENGCISFVCKGCGSIYIDDEGFGRAMSGGPREVPAVPAREDRRRELAKLTKARLIGMCRAGVTRPDGGRSIIEGGLYPLTAWSRDDLVSSVLAAEFPPEPVESGRYWAPLRGSAPCPGCGVESGQEHTSMCGPPEASQ